MITSDKIPNSIYSKEKIKLICDLCQISFDRRYDIVVKSRNLHENKDCCNVCSAKRRGELLKGRKRSPGIIEKILESRSETIAEKYPSLTIACKYCAKKFTVPFRERHRLYCGRSCQSKGIIRNDIRKTSVCLICQKEFKHYGEKILCSRKCAAVHLSQTRIGTNNPMWINQPEKEKCLKCRKEFHYTRSGLHTGQKRVFCSLRCSHNIDLRNNPQSNRTKQYPKEFNEYLKNTIKSRDGRKCQLCGQDDNGSHHIHHIDYNKKNINESNLITLCQKCHNATHHGRTFWEIIFNGLLSGSNLVKKPWGAEIHIANHNDYCLKYLIFFKGYQFSYHTHSLKKELWHCVYGKFECVLGYNGEKRYSIFKAGDKLEINPTVVHQLQAIKNSILVEVSTRDYPEDSIRIIEGCN